MILLFKENLRIPFLMFLKQSFKKIFFIVFEMVLKI